MREAVIFKGARDGLQLVIDDRADFSAVLDELKEKLTSAANFFTLGTKIDIYPAAESIPESQRFEIIRLLADHGLECAPKAEKPEGIMPSKPEYEGIGYETQTLVVEKTLRGGQNITYHGSVVVIGDVNPNASVIAGGNIIVLGKCRGVAHAGAYGNHQATITAGRLIAPQLRIAGLIARAPDQIADKPDFIETARIKNGIVVIERSKQ